MFEKVNPQHPDKVADRIAGAIVDIAYKRDQSPKIAVEVLLGHNKALVMIETNINITEHDVVDTVWRIAGNMQVEVRIVAQDYILAGNQQGGLRCGDNGIFKGCVPTDEQKVLTALANDIYTKHPHDGKYLINESNITVCQSHASTVHLRDEVSAFAQKCLSNPSRLNLHINPLGDWTGGPNVDCGATNRKLGSDMGDGVTGGGLHGKDLSKADVSVNIWCFLEACRTGREQTAICSIGDERVNGVPYSEVVFRAQQYINSIGGFEKFAEWGLIRPATAIKEPRNR